MSCPILLTQAANAADELICRFSNYKVELARQLSRTLLPAGRWGHGPEHVASKKAVYLTFDDGPHPETTLELLSVLKAAGVKASFFLIGDNCERFPELVKRIYEAGHTIGNHGYNHLLMPILSLKNMEAEIVRTNEIIKAITGSAPEVFRPPFGIMDGRTAALLKDHDMTAVYWTSAPEDWLIPGAHRIIRRVMWKIKDGALIVLHEGKDLRQQTVTAAGEIISRSLALDYQFLKVKIRA